MRNDPPPAQMIENRTFDEIAIGDTASSSRAVTQQDVDLIAVLSGDVNPMTIATDLPASQVLQKTFAPGMIGAGLIHGVLGTKLPGPGTIYISQDLHFLHPVWIGDTIEATVTVTAKNPAGHHVTLDCRCANRSGQVVITGTALVRALTEKIRCPRAELPGVQLSRHERFRTLLAQAAGNAPMPTAVAHPCDANSLGAALEAARAGLIVPILVGPSAKIQKAGEGMDLTGIRIVDAPHSVAAAEAAVALVKRGEASLLMKGSLHTDELLHAVLAPDSGLQTGRRLSHVYLMDVPSYPRPLLVTDAAVNIAPDLDEKRDIVQNAIDLAHVMGIACPKVAILAAVETVNSKMRSTLEAAALCKMADRGQITGALVDGPLAFDNAVSPEAAAGKGINSPVAGQADILLVPDLEAGNMLAKQLTFLAGADAAGVVLGARVPIVLTSRADGERTRMASCAVAVLIAKARAGVA